MGLLGKCPNIMLVYYIVSAVDQDERNKIGAFGRGELGSSPREKLPYTGVVVDGSALLYLPYGNKKSTG